jgi:hypothetical protein
VAGREIAHVAVGRPEQPGPPRAAEVIREVTRVRALGRAAVERAEGAEVLGSRLGHSGYDLQRATDRVRSVEDRSRPPLHLDAVEVEEVDRTVVLIRAIVESVRCR